MSVAEQSQTVPLAEPPWTLRGEGYIFLMRFSRAFVEQYGFVPEGWREAYRGGFGTVMIVRYHESDVGPYDELLFIPGKFRMNNRTRYSITRIFVSTEASVVNGRRNWGIPKEVAEFRFESVGTREERVTVSTGGQPFADFTIRSRPIALPFTTALIPSWEKTLIQPHESGRNCLTQPRARGTIQPAKLVSAEIDGALFPDISGERVVAAVRAKSFRMTFPVAEFLGG